MHSTPRITSALPDQKLRKPHQVSTNAASVCVISKMEIPRRSRIACALALPAYKKSSKGAVSSSKNIGAAGYAARAFADPEYTQIMANTAKSAATASKSRTRSVRLRATANSANADISSSTAMKGSRSCVAIASATAAMLVAPFTTDATSVKCRFQLTIEADAANKPSTIAAIPSGRIRKRSVSSQIIGRQITAEVDAHTRLAIRLGDLVRAAGISHTKA